MIAALVLIFVVLFIIGAPIAVALGATSLFNAGDHPIFCVNLQGGV